MNIVQQFAELTIEGARCPIVGYLPWHRQRESIEAYIAQRFHREYGARLSQFMPLLVVLENPQGEPLAIAGVRSALMEPLFLEHYLDAPVEQMLQPLAHGSVPRHQIVEVGNLAAVQSGYARYLFAAMTDLLMAWEFQWLCCTGVIGVRNLFRRLDMEPVVMAPARPERIPDGGKHWGNYYQKNPHVLVGEIRRGRDCVERCGFLAACDYERTEIANVLSA